MLLYIAIIVALFLFYKLVLAKKEEVDDGPEPIVFQSFTPRTLAKYNGREDKHVLMGVKGKVFDVTAGKEHYGPGGAYENFAGRDASRGLALRSFDEEVLTPIDQPLDTLEGLSEEERAQLDQWAEFFEGKYIHCGELVNETN